MALRTTLRTLLFGAAAAAGWPAFALLAAPSLGAAAALALYLVAVLVAYLALHPAPPRARLGAALAAGALGAGLFALAPGVGALALGLAVALALCRGAWLGRGASLRARLAELALLAGGLLAARTLAGPEPLAVALAIWAFFLVQGAGAGLVTAPAQGPDAEGDALERALRRAEALLADDPGAPQ